MFIFSQTILQDLQTVPRPLQKSGLLYLFGLGLDLISQNIPNVV